MTHCNSLNSFTGRENTAACPAKYCCDQQEGLLSPGGGCAACHIYANIAQQHP